MNPPFKRLAFGVTAVALAALGPAATHSWATFPGKNGSLAYDARIGKRYQLFTSKADGSGPQQLTHFADSDAIWAAWSPNGKQIAFERDVYTGVFVTRGAIYTMNTDGSGMRSLTPKGLNGEPSWSPNGKLIVFGTLQFGKQATLSAIAARGSRVRKLLTTPLPCKRFCHCGAWEPRAEAVDDAAALQTVLWNRIPLACLLT